MNGSLTQRGKTSWRYSFDGERHPDGVRNQITGTVHAKDKKGAKAELRTIITEYEKGHFVEPSKQPLKDYLKRWLDAIEASVSGKTHERYGEHIDNHIAPRLGDIVLQKLQPLHVQEFYTHLLTEGRINGKGGLSPRSVKHTHRVLKQALKQAVAWKLATSNPAEDVILPTVKNKKIKFLDRGELATLLHAVENRHRRNKGSALYPIILLAATTGMRRGELLGLHWSDVHLDAVDDDGLPSPYLEVTQTLEQTKKHGLRLKEPKSEAGRRKISLPQITVAMLRQHQLDQSELYLKFGIGRQNGGLVLPVLDNDKGFTFRSPRALSKTFSDFIKNVDITQITLHGLRHTHITHLLMDNVPIKVVSERAGHSSVTITLDTYGHVLPDMQKSVAELIDKRLQAALAK